MSSPPQHMVALQQANKLRLLRAKDKREIASLPRGEAFGVCAAILEEVPAHWKSAVPLELLSAVKFVGRYYALSWLRRAGVQEGRRLSELTERQRSVLAGLLRAGEGRVAA